MASRRKRKAERANGHRGRGMKFFLIGISVLGLLVLGSFVFAYQAVRSYLRSDEFRVMLGERAGAELGGEADFEVFEWDGWSVRTDEFRFSETDGGAKIVARGLEADVDVGAVWRGLYRIEDVRLREIRVAADLRKKDGAIDDEVIEEESVARVSDAKKEGFWQRFLPERVELTGVDVAELRGEVLTDDGLWSWDGVNARVGPGMNAEIYDFGLTGGEIRTPISVVEELDLRSATGRYSGGRLYLLGSRFEALKEARVEMTGDFDFETGAWNLHGESLGGRIEEVIAPDWRQKLMGPMEVSFDVTGEREEDAVTKGKLSIKNGILTALPVLDRIAAYANTARFRRLALAEASLRFRKVGERLELDEILLSSEGLVRLEGRMVIQGEVIERGDFRVGITPGTLAHIPGAETKVFERGELGLLWSPMKISGTLDAPQEDLSERLIAAAGERMFELIPETGQYALKFGGQAIEESTKVILENQGVVLGKGRELANQVGKIVEEQTGVDPSKVIEQGGEVLEKGVETLFDLFGNPTRKSE